MAYVSEWKNDLAEKKVKELQKIQEGLNTLLEWEMFGKEYREIRVLKSLVDCELEARK
jgi:hypothetical protein